MSVFRNVDWETYEELLAGLLPAESSFAVVDPQGDAIWKGRSFAATIAEAVADRLGAEPAEPLDEAITFRIGERPWRAIPLVSDTGTPLAFLTASCPPGIDETGTEKALATIARCLSKDLTLGSELDAMATELAMRYEELNLVYHTEDQVNYFAQGQEALEQLVANCTGYLDVGLTALIMKEKALVLSQPTEGQPLDDTELALERLSSGLYDTVVARREPVVVNRVTSPDAIAAWRGMAYKVLATPILDSKESVHGVLAIVNAYDRPDFTNSDKNLLQVMARKVAKIVQVNYHPLTGLVNREGLEFFAGRLFSDSRTHGTEHCVLQFDIDQLHVVNDTVSHDAGDAIIKAVAARIRQGVRDTDVVSHLGGDEFGVLLKQCPLERGAAVAEKLRESIVDLVVPWTDRSLTATVSVGVAPIDAGTDSPAAALAAAELACDAAKEMGKNRVQRYFHEDTALKRRHHEMEAVGTIQNALKEDRFELYAQVIEPLSDRHHGLHFEILLRLREGDGEPVPPGRFMPAAERYHLMPDIDRWVIRRTLSFLDEHWERLAPQPSMVSINLSGQTLSEPGIGEFLADALAELRVPLERICFEITETAAVANLDAAKRFIDEVRQRGCRFALDDFGSGLSSFGYLRDLPVDYLKIDGSFVKEIATDEVAASMVSAVQQVASVMGLETIAEFVENDAIKDRLRQIGVTFAQGYGIDKPKPLAGVFHVPAERREALAT